MGAFIHADQKGIRQLLMLVATGKVKFLSDPEAGKYYRIDIVELSKEQYEKETKEQEWTE